MRIQYHPRFKKQLSNFSPEIRKKFYKQAGYLLRDFRHPSLHSKKYDESRGIWQARVDKNVRLYFLIDKDICTLIGIENHPK